MIYLVFVISLGFAGLIGYAYREIRESIKKLELQLQKPKVDESKSMILDPDDPLQEAKRQQNELIRKLNP